MDITLSAPPDTIRAVRQWAEASDMSLNQYIRDVLEEKARAIARERARKVKEFADFFKSHQVEMPEGWKFNREEANER